MNIIGRRENLHSNGAQNGKFKIKRNGKACSTGPEDKKGEDIKVIDITEVSVLADYFIIASGTNKNQVQALVDNVDETLGRAGYEAKQMEGYATANWVLLDYNDIIVHVFDSENRLFYDLERIWRDGKTISLDELK